jgi:ankyrin repeat protein
MMLRGNEKNPLLHLAKRQKFNRVLSFLQGDCSKELLHPRPGTIHSFKGETLLHLILPYNPPVEIVDLLTHHLGVVSSDPIVLPEEVANIHGRTPLHVAAAHACDVLVVRRLMVKSDTRTTLQASIRDCVERTPLHWACCIPEPHKRRCCRLRGLCGLGSTCSKNLMKPQDNGDNMVEVVRVLVETYPQAVIMKDANGWTPFHLAVQHKADIRIIRILQHAEKQVYSPTTLQKSISPTHFNSSLDLTNTTQDTLNSWEAEVHDKLRLRCVNEALHRMRETEQRQQLLRSVPTRNVSWVEQQDEDMSSIGSSSGISKIPLQNVSFEI